LANVRPTTGHHQRHRRLTRFQRNCVRCPSSTCKLVHTSAHESTGMNKRRDQSPLYRTPLRGTIVSSPMPQSGVFNTSSSLMRTPPVDLRSGMNPFQKGKPMPRKKKEDAAYRSEKDVIRDYDPDLLVEMDTYGKMAKGMSCPECGSKMRKGAMCKCGGMGKMAKGMSKVTMPPKPGMPMPGMPNQPRPMPAPKPITRPVMSGGKPVGMSRGMGMGKGQGAYIDGQKAPESHPTKMSKGGKSTKSEIDKKLVMFNTKKGMMSKGNKDKIDAQRWNDAAPMMSAANAKKPMVVEQMPSGAIMGRPTSAKNVGSKGSAAKKMSKALPPPPMPKPTRKPDTTMPVYPKPTPTRRPDTTMPVPNIKPPVRKMSKRRKSE